MNKGIKIAIWVVICLVVGYVSSMYTRSSITTWYPTLEKPFFNPPNWLFAPVWIMLYILMGVSAGLVWQKIDTQKELVKKGLFFFTIQLILNGFWSVLFFGWNNILLSLIEIILLFLFLFETYLTFKKLDKTSSLLLIPYMVWVIFASILTASIYFLN
jgi:translocator protein